MSCKSVLEYYYGSMMYLGNVKDWLNFLHLNIVKQPTDTAKMAVPAIVYMIQNNLQFVAVSNLPAATFQVSF